MSSGNGRTIYGVVLRNFPVHLPRSCGEVAVLVRLEPHQNKETYNKRLCGYMPTIIFHALRRLEIDWTPRVFRSRMRGQQNEGGVVGFPY